MASLRRVNVQPGNPALCPQPPPGAGFKLCQDGDVLCLASLPYDGSSCSAPEPDSGSSFPVAAVAVPCAVVGGAVLAGGCWWCWRRRRRRQQQGGADGPQSAAKQSWVSAGCHRCSRGYRLLIRCAQWGEP